MITIICPCGNEIKARPCVANRKKYCSKKCFYKYKIRPSGLKYKIVAENKGWLKKGNIPWNTGLKGVTSAWNKGMKGIHFSPKTEFTSETVLGEKNYKWRGEDVGYSALHQWIVRRYGLADLCENNQSGKLNFPCTGKSKNYDWSLIKGKKYTRNIKNFQKLCHSCHLKYDKQKE